MKIWQIVKWKILSLKEKDELLKLQKTVYMAYVCASEF